MDVDAALDQLQEIKQREADETCSNQNCDNPGTITYYENEYANGFPVCEDCLEILNA